MNRSRTRPLPRGKRIPPFVPVPLRVRADGWTARRQGDFIGFLAETGSVALAAARVGKSRASAYRLRAAPGAESFAAAWDAACGDEPVARKLTLAELHEWAFAGPVVVRLRAGRYLHCTRKPSATVLLRVLARFDRARLASDAAAWWGDGGEKRSLPLA